MVVSGGFESLQGFFLFEKILLSSELQPEGFLSCSDIRHLLCIICRAEDPISILWVLQWNDEPCISYWHCRTGQAVKTLLRKLRINYRDYDSVGEVTITNSAIRNWFRAAQRAHQRSVSMQAVETNSSTCSTESLTAVTRPEQRLLHYLPSVESASVV